MVAIAKEGSAMESLITKACGARSMTQYAASCGISPMHISRIKTGKSIPSKTMCIKLSSDPYVKQLGLCCEDFMKAAGYMDEVEVETTVKYDMLMNQSLDAIFMGVLSKKLLGTGVAFKMLPFGDRPDVDFGIEVYDEKGTTEWGICLSVQGQLDCPDAGRISHYYLMGRLFTFEPAANQQYSLVITDESLFKKIEQSAVISTISANVTIVLLDLKQMTITKEVHIGPSDIEYICLLYTSPSPRDCS